MATGKGTSLGAALLALAAAHGGRKTSYEAKGWHAQISALTGSERGRSFADAAGLSPSPRTLKGWLAETQAPNAANQRMIREAYEAAARRPFPEAMKSGTIEISGLVGDGTAAAPRDRGAGGRSPFRIDASAGDWSAIEDAWEDGTLDEDLFEELFAEDVIGEDIGDPSGGWSFPGGAYSAAQH